MKGERSHRPLRALAIGIAIGETGLAALLYRAGEQIEAGAERLVEPHARREDRHPPGGTHAVRRDDRANLDQRLRGGAGKRTTGPRLDHAGADHERFDLG